MRKPAKLLLALALAWPLVGQAASGASPDPGAYLDLWQLYRQTMESDPRIGGADAQVKASQGQQDSAFGQMLPQLSGGASTSRIKRTEGPQTLFYDGQTYNLSLTQALYNPAAWRGFKKYAEMTKQYHSLAEDTRIQSAADLVQRYFAALAAEDELELATAERKATQRNLDSVSALFDRQLATITDKLQLSARVDSLKTAEIEAKNQIQVTREALAELVGHEIYQPLKRIDDRTLFTALPGSETDWVQSAVVHNPALQAKQEALNSAEYAVSEAKAGHLPTLSLQFGAQRSDFAYENVIAANVVDTYSASLNLQIPLYSGGSVSARTRSLYGSRDSAEDDYEAVRRQVVKETKTAYLKSFANLSKIESSRNALNSAIKSREASEKSFSLGVSTAVDVLNAVRQEYSARRDYLRAQYDFITNQLVLLRWSGDFKDADIQRINAWLSVPKPDETRKTGLKPEEAKQG
ncbi:TolC family outer membrane protein [Pseudomonas rhizoryzae]|uniref:TolC family outer membrane protein n=1 Tax=Pseudomonas rhizoryzae TaxID=2571129 RepID=UPI0007375584|nr:TolC family outer membrane protein [Pseudomonas rhizoryzae]KTT31902.1 type I secretion protein TolC [Pseudomonas psychrotolerans]KTT37217.1 type I secretion protein TolC [Pseudomonas psychrotolerans]KTT71139.1 type I secretion protein TolC [Pseudomonas psychrotolerans]